MPEVIDYQGWVTLGKIYGSDLWDIDVYKEGCKYDKDVLIIHGTSDKMVPHSYSEKADTLFKKSELKFIEGAGHGFRGKNFDIAVKYIDEYLDKIK